MLPYFKACTLSHIFHANRNLFTEHTLMTELSNCLSTSITLRKAIMLDTPHVRLCHTCTSITLQKVISVPRSTALAPRLHHAETARNKRLTPLAFATPCAQIYCENTGIRMLPYFQTCTLSHACHTNCNLLTELPHD